MINNFKEEKYSFLSNMFPAPIIYGEMEFTCAEAAFQATKCANVMDKNQFIDIDGYTAKKLGKTVKLRSDWNDIKLDIMLEICTAKFMQNEKLMEKLIATGDEELIESNEWGDTFWGVCNGTGENHLGKILMQVRGLQHLQEHLENNKDTIQEALDKNNDTLLKDVIEKGVIDLVENAHLEEDTPVTEDTEETTSTDSNNTDIEETITDNTVVEETEEPKTTAEEKPKTGYVHFDSVTNALKNTELDNLYDEIWMIVRSNRQSIMRELAKKCTEEKVKHVPALAPSYELFRDYLNKNKAGQWNKEVFDTSYVPQFLKDMHEKERRDTLNQVYNKVKKDHCRILMLCFCPDETQCHRSIVAGLLQGVGIDTGDMADYSDYFDMYQSSAKVPTVCFTGHRPSDLHGYKSHDDYKLLLNKLIEVCKSMYQKGVRKFITGGAQGVDQLAFWAVHTLKKEYNDIQNVIYVPNKGQERKWKDKGLFAKDEYYYMLKRADNIKYISATYDNTTMHKRNHAMVTDSDYVIAVFNPHKYDTEKKKGTKTEWFNDKVLGGTAGTIRHAYNENKPIYQINYNTAEIYKNTKDITVDKYQKKQMKKAQ